MYHAHPAREIAGETPAPFKSEPGRKIWLGLFLARLVFASTVSM
jgi:hypothetical protein